MQGPRQKARLMRVGGDPYMTAPCSQLNTSGRYLSCVEILPKLVFSLVPMPFTAAMIAMEMPAAIRPYSIAVAPY